ncbi:hypothetical protein [Algoriphagus aquimarinus]
MFNSWFAYITQILKNIGAIQKTKQSLSLEK